MSIVLFADQYVGLKTTTFLAKKKALSLLVLNKNRKDNLNEKIIKASHLSHSNILCFDKSPNNNHISKLKKASPSLIILAWWPYIIKNNILSIPSIGCLNFHPSLLPYNAGKHYSFWTIIEETPFGVTIHWVNEGIDTGNIAFQKKIKKSWLDTGYTLKKRAEKSIVKLFKDNFINIINKKIPNIPQNINHRTYHHSSEIEDACTLYLNQQYSLKQFLNTVRAKQFPGLSGARYKYKETYYEIYTEITQQNISQHSAPLSLDTKKLGLSWVHYASQKKQHDLFFINKKKIYKVKFFTQPQKGSTVEKEM